MTNNDVRDEMIMRCYNAWNPHQHHWPPDDAFAAGWRWRSEVENAELAEQAAEVEQLRLALTELLAAFPDGTEINIAPGEAERAKAAWQNARRLAEHGTEGL